MTLLELGLLINENIDVSVIDFNTQKEFAKYDWENSVPEEYNDCKVISVDIDWEEKMMKIEVER